MFKHFLVKPTIDKRSLEINCNFGNLLKGVIFAKNGDIILSFTDVGKLDPSHEILTSQICLLTLQ